MDQTHLEITSASIFKIVVFKGQMLPAEESCYQTLNSAAQLPWKCPGYKEGGGTAFFLFQGEETVLKQDGSFQVVFQRCLDDS